MLFVLLSNYSSAGEAIVVGLLQGVFIALIIWVINSIRKKNRKNRQEGQINKE
jgi:hypothetical protein